MASPLLPTGNPLLDDALDDAYQDDLERRNLRGKKPRPDAIPFTPKEWVSLGYWAHIDQQECEACGSAHSFLVGVFHREHAKDDPSAIRSTRLDLRRFRDLNILPREEIIPVRVPLCGECVFCPQTN